MTTKDKDLHMKKYQKLKSQLNTHCVPLDFGCL